ncbi:MAG TPA: hypothetical protein VEW28_07390 [Candidatus Kapabacteria bacterium]|nr:hypothetical protein [Candidatus Kapabacteria bacterium]
MNRELLEILLQQNELILSNEDKRAVEFFAEYLDHGSLFLLRYEMHDEPVFVFTNDAQRFRFTLSQIKEHYAKMKSGMPLDWDEIPFEYISKN